MTKREYQIQAAIFKWAASNIEHYPELELLFASKSAGIWQDIAHICFPVPRNLPSGKRPLIRTGLPSVQCCMLNQKVPDSIYPCLLSGLWIGFNVGKSKLAEKRIEWGQRLRAQGHRVKIVSSWEEAVNAIVDYIKLDAVFWEKP